MNSFLKISIHNKPPLDQGKYHLTFNILKGKPASPPEPLYIDLTVKPATIAPLHNVVVSRVQNFPFFPYKLAYKPVTLFETSRNAIVSPITIRELTLVDTKGANVPATIKFTNTDQIIEAGRQADLSYEVIGDLPIGTAMATFIINAPQLAAPVQFKMDIITKRGGWWIFIIILAGLLFGYTTRIALNNILQLNKSRKEAIDLLRLLDEEKANRPDETFSMAVDKMQKKLNASINSGTAKITEVITDIKTDLAATFTDFNKRQTELQTKLKSFSDALTGIWFLPDQVESIIATASNSLNEVNALIIANNPGAGEEALQKLNVRLAKDFIIETRKFKNKLKETYESIKQSTLKIAVVESPLLKEVNDLATSLAAIPEDKFEESPENIRVLLQALSTQKRRTIDLYSNISLTIKLLLETLANIFINGKIDLQNELLAIGKKSDLKFSLQSDKALDKALTALAADMKDIQNDILQTFTSAKLGLKEDQIKTIHETIAAGHYSDAANNIVVFKRAIIINEATMANYSYKTLIIPPQISFASVHNTGFIQRPVSVTDPFNNKAKMSTTNTRYSEILRTIFWTSLLQTLLIGIGIAIFGYSLFVEKFTGTVTDMIEIFSWAFVLDVSINTLTTAAGGIPKKIKA